MGRPVPVPILTVKANNYGCFIACTLAVAFFALLIAGNHHLRKRVESSPEIIYVTNTIVEWRTNTTFVPGYYPNPYTPENGYTTTNVEVREWFSGMSSNDMATLRDLSPEALEAYWNSLTPEQKLDAR